MEELRMWMLNRQVETTREIRERELVSLLLGDQHE